MCGIFGIVAKNEVKQKELKWLAKCAKERGQDSSGIIYFDKVQYKVNKSNSDILNLLKKQRKIPSNFILGHSRLITDGLEDNQPVVRDSFAVLHNGIIVNTDEIWGNINLDRNLKIDSEAILGLTIDALKNKYKLEDLCNQILSKTKGTVSCALILPNYGKLLLLSNNGSLYKGEKNDTFYFASEKYPLSQLHCAKIVQVDEKGFFIDIPKADSIENPPKISRKMNIIPSFKNIVKEESLLEFNQHNLVRCTKCVLPETMPFIEFDDNGVCNYCRNYKLRNIPKPKSQIFDLIEPYRDKKGPDCIVPFSGGRDSSYALHLIVNELKLKPITYTYDWGMNTDLARRNVSRMCSELKVENIIIAANIERKRKNIRTNLKAWLKNPHLGLISILTAGDKHFYRHTETIKKQTGLSLNLWGICPLETTHFKAGFLGIEPPFEQKHVYIDGLSKQLNYHRKRFKAMLQSPGHFNFSLFDTLWGEYGRSINKKTDYFHIYDYWRWDEHIIKNTLLTYDWEVAPDTQATWRIGDGTAAFYNYLYYTIAGFTEHDTFRSNQIRENQLTREKALLLINEENKPRYQNIRWYLDTIDMDFTNVIKRINSINKLYHI